MHKYAYKIIANRIAKIRQRQFQILNYLESNKEIITEFQKGNLNSLMASLKEEKEELEMILKKII